MIYEQQLVWLGLVPVWVWSERALEVHILGCKDVYLSPPGGELQQQIIPLLIRSLKLYFDDFSSNCEIIKSELIAEL